MISYSFESDFQDLAKPQQDNQLSTKACLFNLIVISYDLESSVYCQELIRIITEKFPCRILFVRGEQESQYDFARMSKSMQIVGSENNKVVCDFISIEASSKQFNQVPFLILPNIVPDLPVYIVLAYDPTKDTMLLHQVEALANRVIFGTPYVDNMQRFTRSVIKLIKANHRQFIDIHWARSKAWREVLAKVFSSPEKLEAFASAKSIHIAFAGQPGTTSNRYEPQALYLQAWIASRFGWKIQSVDGPRSTPRITYATKTGNVTISFSVQDSELLDRGALWSVEIMGEKDYHFLISHEGDSKHVKVHASGPDRCEMPYTIFMSNYQRGSALIGEIFYQPPSEHYASMLEMFDSDVWNQHAMQNEQN